MNTKRNRFKNLVKGLVMPLMVCSLFLLSCKSNAQEQKEKVKTEKEGSGHDKDGEHHGKETKGHDNDKKSKAERGEHARDKGENGEGEEDGTQFSKKDTYDVTKHGVRLVLKFNESKNAFIGTMHNTSSKSIDRARVEVHLSNGTELGPTKPVTLKPNAKQDVFLTATKSSFKSWSTHAEVGNAEHGHSKENKEGHSKREKGEHKNKKGEHN